MRKEEIIHIVKSNIHVREDGGTRELMTQVASYYGVELPPYIASALLSAVGAKNKYMKKNPTIDLRIKDMHTKSQINENQLSFAF